MDFLCGQPTLDDLANVDDYICRHLRHQCDRGGDEEECTRSKDGDRDLGSQHRACEDGKDLCD